MWESHSGYRVVVRDLPVFKGLAEKSRFNFLFSCRTSCYVSGDEQSVLRAGLQSRVALSLESVFLRVGCVWAGCWVLGGGRAMRGLVRHCFGPREDGPGPLALELQAHFREHSAHV